MFVDVFLSNWRIELNQARDESKSGFAAPFWEGLFKNLLKIRGGTGGEQDGNFISHR